MSRVSRSITVTALVAAAGAVAGALVAWTSFTLLGVLAGFPHWLPDVDEVRILLPVGAAFGTLIGPGILWGVLRRAPIGLAAVVTATAAVPGIVAGAMLRQVGWGWVWGGLIAVGLAVRALRRRYPARGSTERRTRLSSEFYMRPAKPRIASGQAAEKTEPLAERHRRGIAR